jgi:hypothetical protein
MGRAQVCLLLEKVSPDGLQVIPKQVAQAEALLLLGRARRRRCLDHVVPRAELGRNSYRNLVSCCVDCNSQKRERPAKEFVPRLYRERRLSNNELSGRLRALDDLAAGKLMPPLSDQR